MERRFDRPNRRQPASPCVGDGMITRRVVMAARDVVFFKGIIEASEGLAAVFAERGGDLTVAAPMDRVQELDAVLDDLCAGLGALRLTDGPTSTAIHGAKAASGCL